MSIHEQIPDVLPLAPLIDEQELSEDYLATLGRVLSLAGRVVSRIARRNARLESYLLVAREQLRPFRAAAGLTPFRELHAEAEIAAVSDGTAARARIGKSIRNIRALASASDLSEYQRRQAWRSETFKAGLYAPALPEDAHGVARSALLGAAMAVFDARGEDLNEELWESWTAGSRLATFVRAANVSEGLVPECDPDALADAREEAINA